MSDICRCSHPRSLHDARTGACVALPNDQPLSWWCGCKAFTPKDDRE